MRNSDTLFRCPCCGYRTLERPDAMALCPVCWWEDDGQEDPDAEDVHNTVNGSLSLNDARMYYTQCAPLTHDSCPTSASRSPPSSNLRLIPAPGCLRVTPQ